MSLGLPTRAGSISKPRVCAYSKKASLNCGLIGSAFLTMALTLSGNSTGNTPSKNLHASSKPSITSSKVWRRHGHTNWCRLHPAVQSSACIVRVSPVPICVNPPSSRKSTSSTPGSGSTIRTVSEPRPQTEVLGQEALHRSKRHGHAGRLPDQLHQLRSLAALCGPLPHRGGVLAQVGAHRTDGGGRTRSNGLGDHREQIVVHIAAPLETGLLGGLDVPTNRLPIGSCPARDPPKPTPQRPEAKDLLDFQHMQLPERHVTSRTMRKEVANQVPARHSGWSHDRGAGWSLVRGATGVPVGAWFVAPYRPMVELLAAMRPQLAACSGMVGLLAASRPQLAACSGMVELLAATLSLPFPTAKW